MEVFKLFGSILVDSDEAERSLSRTEQKSQGLGDRLGSGIKTAAKWGAAITGAAVAAGGAMFALTNRVTANADAVAKGAAKMGVSTDFYQEMDYWAGQNGVSQDAMGRALGRLNQRMGSAAEGNEKYSSALERLGVDMDGVREGTVSTEDAFATSIQTLSEMTNEQEKSALASELFGTKLARDLMPALQDGSLSIEEAKEKAQELGLVMSEDQIEAAEKFQDSYDDIKRSVGAFIQQVGLELMPIFQTMMDWIMEHMPQIRETMSTVFDAIKTVVGTFIDVIGNVIEWLSTWFSSNEETMTGIWDTIKETFNAIKEIIEEIWSNVTEFWKEHGQEILDNAIQIFTNVWETIETAFNAIWSLIQEILGLVVPFIQEQLDKIFAFWDEHGEQIMAAVDNVFSFIQGVIETVMPIIEGIIRTAWGIIETIIDTVTGVIMGIIQTFASLLTGDFEGIKEGLTKIWDSLWEGIKGVVDGAWDMLSGAFSTLWDSISGWFTDIVSDALGWGKDLIRGFWDGITGMGSWLSRKIGGFISDNVPGPIKRILGIKSPSRLMMQYGEDTGEGFALGMEDKEDRLEDASRELAGSAEIDPQTGSAAVNQAGQGMAAAGAAGAINFEKMFDGAVFNVRSDDDIKMIAREIGNMTKKKRRGLGID